MAVQWQKFFSLLILSQCFIWISVYYLPIEIQWSWDDHYLDIHLPTTNSSSNPNDLDIDLDDLLESEELYSESDIPEVALPTRGAIIAPRFQDANLDWVYRFQNDYDIYIYQVDSPTEALPIPANKGHEAMVYLSFIIDHYDKLPPYNLFIHGHRTSWHQLDGTMNSLIHDLQIPTLESEGYINFRCSGGFACAPKNYIHPRPNQMGAVDYGDEKWPQSIDGIIDAWPHIFGEEEELPERIGSMCCAQFAVTRDFILKREKEVYVRARQWLLETELEDKFSGRVFEKIWAYLMTKEEIVCPSKQHCLCKYFGRCEKGPEQGLA